MGQPDSSNISANDVTRGEILKSVKNEPQLPSQTVNVDLPLWYLERIYNYFQVILIGKPDINAGSPNIELFRANEGLKGGILWEGGYQRQAKDNHKIEVIVNNKWKK